MRPAPTATSPRRWRSASARLGFTGPLAAVRDLHAAIRADGETPARVGALVRGYALLGVLTEFHWHPAHKAYKARALLYAQRLVARDPKSPWGLWHRAFAEALAGMPKNALDDLAAAQAIAGAEGAPKPPAWVVLVDASCRHDAARLRNADGPHADLAALLRMMAEEYPPVTAASLRAAREVVSRAPECFRAHDQMCQVGGVSNLHVATTLGPQVLDRVVPRTIREMEGLPAGVRDVIDRQAGEVALAEALSRAGAVGADDGEPSWGALAQMVRETRFVQVARRLLFMRYMWSVPVDEFWAESHLSVAGHRYRPYLQWLALRTPEEARTFAEFAKGLDVADLEIGAIPMIKELEQAQHGRENFLFFTTARAHTDELARDYAAVAVHSRKEEMVRLAHTLLDFSPHSPFAMNLLINNDWDRAEPRVAGWLERAGDSAGLLGALGWRYTELGRVDEAQPLLERYIRLSPDAWAYEAIAKNSKAKGDLARWQSTLDDYLANVEDYRLDHARVRVEVANHFMKEGEWAKARPYAEAAAQSWAGWAMACAVRCDEGLEDWDRAELWIRRVSERYPNGSWPDWYIFCKRTGRGDAEAARDYCEQYLATYGDRRDLVGEEPIGFFRWASGSPEKARDAFRKGYEINAKEARAVVNGLSLVVIADELGDAALRDQVLDDLVTSHRDHAPRTIAIFGMFRDALARGEPGAPDPAALARAVGEIKPESRGMTEFYVGMFLRSRGRRGEAEGYLRRCVDSPHPGWMFVWMQALAAEALRAPRGGPPASG